MKKGAARMKREEKTGRCRKKVESANIKKGQLALNGYHIVAKASLSCFEAHVGLFRLLIKGGFICTFWYSLSSISSILE